MPRTNWNIYKKLESGDNWVADGTIPAPNDNLELPIISTQVKAKSADGDNVYTIPSTKYTEEPLSFIWLSDDGTIETKIRNYVKLNTDLKIVDSNNDEYIGRFIYLAPVWLVGQSPDEYSLSATFERIPSL